MTSLTTCAQSTRQWDFQPKRLIRIGLFWVVCYCLMHLRHMKLMLTTIAAGLLV